MVGDLVWIPGPNPTPWYLAVAGVAGGVVLLGRGRRWPATALCGVAVLAAGVVLDGAGAWFLTAEPAGSKFGPLLAPAVCLFLAVSGLPGVTGRPSDAGSATALCRLLLGSLGTAVVLGLVHLDWLRRWQLPSTLHPDLARTTVVAAAGVGMALVALSMCRLGARYVRRRAS